MGGVLSGIWGISGGESIQFHSFPFSIIASSCSVCIQIGQKAESGEAGGSRGS